MNDRPHYPWKEGDALFADELNAAIANAGSSAESGGAENVIGHGADPTGVADSAPAFAAALAVRRNGRPVDVFAPAGTYLLNSPITIGDNTYAQRLFGEGWSTVLTVGPRFSSSALGVILIGSGAFTGTYNDQTAQASVCDLRIHFQQPPDFTTTATAQTVAGGTTLTVANVSGIHVGYYCADLTNSGALPWQSIAPQVTNIAGNVITLDRAAIGNVDIGNVLAFAANRSQAVALSTAPNLNPGSPAITYPWAIYAVAQSVFMDHVLVSGAWNGVYIRGQSFAIGQYFEGCLNIGLDIDDSYNFPKLDHFMHWGWGIPYAMLGIYYDGQTIAANLGECDSLNCDVIQTWCGIVNLTSRWSWGAINQLALDGDNANLNVVTPNTNSWLQIGSLYKTGGLNGIGVPLLLSGACKVSIDNVLMACAQNNPAIRMTGGSLTIASGYTWGVSGANPVINVTGGDLAVDQMRFDAPAASGVSRLVQTGGTVRVSNSALVTPPGAGPPAAFVLTNSPRNSISNVDLNGWGGAIPPTSLPRVAISTSYANDAAAAAGGVEIGQEYRNGSIRMVRVA